MLSARYNCRMRRYHVRYGTGGANSIALCARARSKPYTPVGLRTRLGFSAIARLPFYSRAVAIGRPPFRFSGQQRGCHVTASPPPRWRPAGTRYTQRSFGGVRKHKARPHNSRKGLRVFVPPLRAGLGNPEPYKTMGELMS